MNILEPTKVSDNQSLHVVNNVYEMMNDPTIFNTFADRLAELIDNQSNIEGVVAALEASAKLADRVLAAPEVDLTSEIGVLVVGVSRNNIITHVPPQSEAWLKTKFVSNSKGMGWIDTQNNVRNIAHVLQLDGQRYLPVHPILREGLKSGSIARLIVVHQFSMTDGAMSALTELYELTPAEIKLCMQLAEGKTLNDAAIFNKVKKSTVRSQLKTIFGKMGVKSQSELVRILTQISAASAIQAFSNANKIALDPNWKNGLVSIQTEFCKTRYGTRLAYSKFGDPKGRPVLYFHHGLGSRVHSRQMAEAAKKHGCLIYKFERPGYGHSDVLPDMSVKAIGHMTEDLIKHIGASRVSAIGYGVGGRTLLDVLPYVNERIDNVVLYSFRGGLNNAGATVMQKLSRLIWENPAVFINFMKIMMMNASEEKVRKNLQKYYQSSEVDLKILDNPAFIIDRIREIELAMRQDFAGTIFDYKNARRPVSDYSHRAFAIPVKAIFGALDSFNTLSNNKPYLSQLPQCKTYMSQGDGQLHIDHDFDRFLHSAFKTPNTCDWLSEMF